MNAITRSDFNKLFNKVSLIEQLLTANQPDTALVTRKEALKIVGSEHKLKTILKGDKSVRPSNNRYDKNILIKAISNN